VGIHDLINFIIGKIKNKSYNIDKDIPVSYLISIVTKYFYMIVRGLFVFCKKSGFLFIGSHSKIICPSKLIIGKNVSIDRYSYIDSLSKEGLILGDNVSIGKNTTIECTGNLQYLGKGLIVGNNVGMGTHGYFGCSGGIEIGDDTIIGNFVSMHSENHNFSDLSKPIRLQGLATRELK
jgi:acetyltransferase-like isoleucine patch superfamily enzyme